MKNPHLLKANGYFKEELKDPEFKRMYEVEQVKVALAQKIAELRDRQHLNQSQLAKKMNVTQQFISQLENGDKANVTLETLAKIARSLNMAVEISFRKLGKKDAILRVV